MAENEEVFNTNLSEVEKSLQTEKGKQAFAELEASLAVYREARAKTLELSRNGSQAAAYALNKGEVVPDFAEVAEHFNELYESKVALAAAQNAEIQDTYKNARTRSFALIAIALLGGIGTAWWISRRRAGGLGAAPRASSPSKRRAPPPSRT